VNIMTRRQLIRSVAGFGALGAASALLAACGQPAPPAPTSAPTAAPKPTEASKPAATTAPAPTAAAAAAPTSAAAATTAPAAAPTTAQAAAAPTQAGSGLTLPKELTPGSPDHAKGWTVSLPPRPATAPSGKPPVAITASKRLSGAVKFAKGDSVENSLFTRLAKEAFGIDWKIAWTWVTYDEAQQKYSLGMASGQLPDFMETVPNPTFPKMVQANAVEDITDVYNAVADPEWVKKPLETNERAAWDIAEVNGRKFALPQLGLAAQNQKVLWYRQDWLEKINMAVPKTVDEVGQVGRAIVKANLGKGTTVGLPIPQNVIGWGGGMHPVFGAYGVMPGFWTEAGDGLTYNTLLPPVKEVLGILRQWYADGVINSDFYSRDDFKTNEIPAGNQAGMIFEEYYFSLDPGPASTKNDPQAHWAWADLPTGPSGKRADAWTNPFGLSAAVNAFRKGFQHVDMVLGQINWLAQLTGDPKRRLLPGWEGYNYEWSGDQVKLTGLEWGRWTVGHIGHVGTGVVDPLGEFNRDKLIDDEWVKIPKEQRDAWQLYATEGDPTGWTTMGRKAYEFVAQRPDKELIKNMFRGLPTPTMAQTQATLGKAEGEMLAGIVAGQKPLTAWDDFVDQWHKLGGDQITAEVNQWWKARKK